MLTIRTCCIAALLGLVALRADAAVISANSCSSTDVQNAINAAGNGDTVSLPAGCTATWNATVTIPTTKGITLNGNSANILRGSLASGAAALTLLVNSSTGSRITGFKFSDTKSSNGVFISAGGGNESSAKFRIDHCTFLGMDVGTHIKIGSPIYGVIDHNTFTWEGNNEVIHNEAYGANSDAGWRNDVVPGSASALYIEDNTFTNAVTGNPAYFRGGSANQSYYGARTVFRYNNLNMAHFDQHGTAGMIGARWWEVYENTYFIVPNGNQSDYVALRGGSGVVFNNHVTGSTNLGAGSVTLYEEDSGYPALYQVGRGKDQALTPAYIWGNDSAMHVGSGSSNVVANRDFYLSPKPGYTPYVYPHPLVSGSSQQQGLPAAPANLRLISQ